MSFTVAIVGRPNVGKSTLFNRLIGKRRALVDDTPGVTRDRRVGDGRLGPLRFRIIDTAGLEDAAPDTLEGRMRHQTEMALAEADVALFVVDARAGLTPMDKHFADWLRRSKTPVLLLANKTEGRAGQAGVVETYELGLGDPIAISAEHGEGLSELFDALEKYAPAEPADTAPEGVEPELEELDDDNPEAPIQLAIVGRPNAGKSTLVNRLLGEDRMLTGPEPGLTRDSITIEWNYKGRPIRLVDTAGIRRKARVEAKLEKLSVAETLRAIRLAQVVVLMIDGQLVEAKDGMDKQDLTIADHVVREGRGLVIAINKWDLVDDRAKTLKSIEDRLSISLPQVKGVPVTTLSALNGRHLDRLLPTVLELYDRWNKRVSTSQLNRWLADATDQHPPPAVQGRHIRLRYATQVKARPPTFALFTNRPDDLPESYQRYLLNSLREVFDLNGVAARLLLRKSKNPYADE